MVSLKEITFILLSALLPMGINTSDAGHSGPWKDTENQVLRREYENHSDDFGDEESEPNSNSENYFQEIYMLQSAPKQIEFGHVFENPDEWEQRYEKKDFDHNRHQGKVRWADKDGGHGEHYWDYNHAGPSDNEKYSESVISTSVTEVPMRQHQKRQLPDMDVRKEDSNTETTEDKLPPWFQEAEEFLTSFHKEIGGSLELNNKNYFSRVKTDNTDKAEKQLRNIVKELHSNVNPRENPKLIL